MLTTPDNLLFLQHKNTSFWSPLPALTLAEPVQKGHSSGHTVYLGGSKRLWHLAAHSLSAGLLLATAFS